MSLRGASAETYAALSGAVDTALAGGADAARVGDDLFSVAEVLRSEPGLRRIATDVSVDSAAKAGLARQIFGGKLSDDALVVVESAFARRWTQVRDLASALEELGVRAVVTSAGSDSGRLADELFALSELLDANPELRSALADPARSREDKRALLARSAGGPDPAVHPHPGGPGAGRDLPHRGRGAGQLPAARRLDPRPEGRDRAGGPSARRSVTASVWRRHCVASTTARSTSTSSSTPRSSAGSGSRSVTTSSTAPSSTRLDDARRALAG